jgi:hypothetical protein
LAVSLNEHSDADSCVESELRGELLSEVEARVQSDLAYLADSVYGIAGIVASQM